MFLLAFYPALIATELQTIFKFLFPDITIGTSNGDYAQIYGRVNHELAHASHFSVVENEFWERYISYIIYNNGYGNSSSYDAQVCGIGEMWGYFMQKRRLTDKYPEYNFSFNSYWFKPELLWDINNSLGIGVKSIFDCLTADTDTFEELANNLCEAHPDIGCDIVNMFNTYLSLSLPMPEYRIQNTDVLQDTTIALNAPIKLDSVIVKNGASLNLIGTSLSIYPPFSIEAGSSFSFSKFTN